MLALRREVKLFHFATAAAVLQPFANGWGARMPKLSHTKLQKQAAFAICDGESDRLTDDDHLCVPALQSQHGEKSRWHLWPARGRRAIAQCDTL